MSGSDHAADRSATATHPLQEAYDDKQAEEVQGVHPSWQSGEHQPQPSSSATCGNQPDGNRSAYNGSNGNG